MRLQAVERCDHPRAGPVLGADRGQGHHLRQPGLAHRCRKGAADLVRASIRIAAEGRRAEQKAALRAPHGGGKAWHIVDAADRYFGAELRPPVGLLRSPQHDADRLAQLDQRAGGLAAGAPVCSKHHEHVGSPELTSAES